MIAAITRRGVIGAFGDAMHGARLRRGLGADESDARRFLAWFATLLREHGPGR